MNPSQPQPFSPLLQARYDTLLAMSDLILACRTMKDLVGVLAQSLGSLTRVDSFAVQLYDAQRDTMVVHMAALSSQTVTLIDRGIPSDAGPSGVAYRTQKHVLIPDWERESRWPLVREIARSIYGARASLDLPLTTARRRLGTLTFICRQPDVYDEPEAAFLGKVSSQVAIAVENILNFETAEGLRRQLGDERDRLRLLLDVNNVTVTHLDLGEMFIAFSRRLRQRLNHQFGSLLAPDKSGENLVILATEHEGITGLLDAGASVAINSSIAGKAFTRQQLQIADRRELEEHATTSSRRVLDAGIQSVFCLPLTIGPRVLGVLAIGCTRPDPFDQEATDLLLRAAGQLVIAVDNALAFRQIQSLKDRLAQEKLYLEEEAAVEYSFDEIVGRSPAIKRVLAQVEVVASTDATVLIRGETGTGKELIARALHRLSSRHAHSFIKMNCAAVPANLMESELFGHEKGAFTGAVSQRAGRFELADNGTLFLDEVGDMPPELQPKLLRVLQDQEFERVGGSRTLKTNTRIVSATNRNLEDMVAEGKFRSDLYYRLNVFPLDMPALRDRAEDIPLLVRFFTDHSARKLAKRIDTIPAQTLDALAAYPWPGNLRELQNFIERSVILSTARVLQAPLAELRPPRPAPSRSAPQPRPANGCDSDLDAVQRDHILSILRQTSWVLGGPEGAAAKLGLKRTTLQSRMRKLGIARPV